MVNYGKKLSFEVVRGSSWGCCGIDCTLFVPMGIDGPVLDCFKCVGNPQRESPLSFRSLSLQFRIRVGIAGCTGCSFGGGENDPPLDVFPADVTPAERFWHARRNAIAICFESCRHLSLCVSTVIAFLDPNYYVLRECRHLGLLISGW